MGNWKKIVKEYSHLIDRRFVDQDGKEWYLFGLVHGSDDFYYGLCDDDSTSILTSCVGRLEDMGYTLKEEPEFPGLNTSEEKLYNELRVKVISKVTDEELKMFNKLLNKICKYKSTKENSNA